MSNVLLMLWRRFRIGLLSGGLIAILTVASLIVLLHRRDQELDRASRTFATLAVAVAEQTARSFQAVDLVLKSLDEDIVLHQSPTVSLRDYVATRQFHDALAARASGLPQIDTLSVADDKGDVLNFGRYWPLPQINIADRDYFRVLQDDPGLETYVSKPVQNRGNGTWTIYVARRIATPQNRFLGLVLGSIRLDYFNEFFKAMGGFQDLRISLHLRDGSLLAQYPTASSNIGTVATSQAMVVQLGAGQPEAEDRGPGRDGVERLRAGRAVEGFPLWVSITRPESAVLEGWRLEAVMVGLTWFGTVVLGVVLVLLLRQSLKREMSEKLLGATVESVSQGIAMIDRDGRLRVCNSHAMRLLKLPAYRIGTPVLPRELLLDREWVDEGLDHGRDGTVVEHRLGDGSIVEVRTNSLPIGGVVQTYTDMTERKLAELANARAEAAEEADRLKSAFLATMSHELRTPLNAIIGFSEIMANEMLGPIGSPQYREYGGDINRSGVHLLAIVNDILDFSKMESGTAQVVLDTVDGVRVAEQVHRMLALYAEEREVTLTVEADGEPEEAMHTDPGKLRQILLNLVTNGIKFTPPGGSVCVHVRSDPLWTTFSVRDTGRGIAPADIPKAFAPFGQVDSGRGRSFEGTGLGLPLARGYTHLLGGTLELASVVGQGTVVTLRLPNALARLDLAS